MRIHIFLNGDYQKGYKFDGSDYIICADGGAVHALEEGLTPRLIIGDLDSISPNTEAYYRYKDVLIIKYQPEKDFTDGELALNEALAVIQENERYDEIVFHAATGGRIDHSLSHLQLLYRVLLYNKNVSDNGKVKCRIVDGKTEIYLIDGSFELFGKQGDILSILPFADYTRGIEVKNVKYPVPSVFKQGMVIGMSNIFMGDMVKMSLNEGALLIIHTKI